MYVYIMVIVTVVYGHTQDWKFEKYASFKARNQNILEAGSAAIFRCNEEQWNPTYLTAVNSLPALGILGGPSLGMRDWPYPKRVPSFLVSTDIYFHPYTVRAGMAESV